MISISIDFAIIRCSTTLSQVKRNISFDNASMLYQIFLPVITDDHPILKSHNNVDIYMAFKKMMILLATGRLSSTRYYIHMLWNGWKRVWQAKKPTDCSLRHQRMPRVFFQGLRWFSWWLDGCIILVKYTILKEHTVQSPAGSIMITSMVIFFQSARRVEIEGGNIMLLLLKLFCHYPDVVWFKSLRSLNSPFVKM